MLENAPITAIFSEIITICLGKRKNIGKIPTGSDSASKVASLCIAKYGHFRSGPSLGSPLSVQIFDVLNITVEIESVHMQR